MCFAGESPNNSEELQVEEPEEIVPGAETLLEGSSIQEFAALDESTPTEGPYPQEPLEAQEECEEEEEVTEPIEDPPIDFTTALKYLRALRNVSFNHEMGDMADLFSHATEQIQIERLRRKSNARQASIHEFFKKK